MGANFTPAVLLIGGVWGGMVTHEYTKSTALSVVVGIATGFVFLCLFYYSPIPHHNGGWGLPPAKRQKWGFTTEPAGEYEESTTEERMKPALKGINMARRKEDENGD